MGGAWVLYGRSLIGDPAGNSRSSRHTEFCHASGRLVSEYYHRISQVLDSRFRALVLRWLKKLPRAGWSGTPRGLAAELADEATHGEYVGKFALTKLKASCALED